MGDDVCDQETKKFFKWGYILNGVVLAAVTALGSLVIEIRDHAITADLVHEQIEPGFFTKSRYGRDDHYDYEDKMNAIVSKIELQIARLDKQIELVRAEDRAHDKEADIWKEKITFLIDHVRNEPPHPNGH